MRFVRAALSWLLVIFVVLVAASFGQLVIFGFVTPGFPISVLFCALFCYALGRVGIGGGGNS